jgi:NSS family neurotransmitter:Na+ symporter
MLPLGGALMAYFVGFMMKPEIVEEEMNDLPTALFKLWYFLIRNVAPVAALVIFIHVTGIGAAMSVLFGWS